MVQYIITPWRTHDELFSVRSAFYPVQSTSSEEHEHEHSRKSNSDHERRTAVARVSVWVQRGNCPHSVESTALLVSAMLNDTKENSAYAVRAAYSAAFSRFVTGLLDGYQDKKHKMSMYAIATSIGLPATFVELRHQCTHEELPGLGRLRAAAEKAMQWIWEFYWSSLREREGKHVNVSRSRAELRQTVEEWVRWRARAKGKKGRNGDRDLEEMDFKKRLGKWSADEVTGVLLEDVTTGPKDLRALLESARLARELLSSEGKGEVAGVAMSMGEKAAGLEIKSLDEIRTEMERAGEELGKVQDVEETVLDKIQGEDVEMDDNDDDDGGTGWEMWKGPWVPKPIGVV